MAEKERLVTFEILGQQYRFYTGATEEELQAILSLVRSLVEAGTPGAVGTLPVGKIAVLACLNIASRYVKLKQDYEKHKEESEKRLSQLAERVENALSGD